MQEEQKKQQKYPSRPQSAISRAPTAPDSNSLFTLARQIYAKRLILQISSRDKISMTEI